MCSIASTGSRKEVARLRGTGLGLSIAERNVRLHGGHLRVRSQPNSGSVFTIVLPLASSTLVHVGQER